MYHALDPLELFVEASRLPALLRGCLEPRLQRLQTPEKRPERQISCETSPKTQEERRLSYEGENRFWRRLGGQGEYESGSRLRLLRQDALTRRAAGLSPKQAVKKPGAGTGAVSSWT